MPVGATYPKHELSDIKPNHETGNKLKEHRKNVEKQDIRSKKNANEKKILDIKSLTFKDYYQPQEYVANPRYNATW